MNSFSIFVGVSCLLLLLFSVYSLIRNELVYRLRTKVLAELRKLNSDAVEKDKGYILDLYRNLGCISYDEMMNKYLFTKPSKLEQIYKDKMGFKK